MSDRYMGQMQNEYGEMMDVWVVNGTFVARPTKKEDKEDKATDAKERKQ